MIPPAYRVPGGGPGGNLVGPGSSIFHPHGGNPYEIDPALGGGIPRL